jgi:dTDP-glucose pyrophosphorylase
MWGIVAAAGHGTRIQPLAFSKELLPVGSRCEAGIERPRAVSEYIVERMVRGGADKIGFVIAPGKADIVRHFGSEFERAAIAYVVQPKPCGLCDAIFRVLPFIHPDEPVIVGLPDTVWFPEDALLALANDRFAFLLFPVERPDLFDAVVIDDEARVREVQVKRAGATTKWIWGAFKLPGAILHELHRLWLQRGCSDEYVGTLVNAWIAGGGVASGVQTGRSYMDVGTVDGYREAIALLRGQAASSGGRSWTEAGPIAV